MGTCLGMHKSKLKECHQTYGGALSQEHNSSSRPRCPQGKQESLRGPIPGAGGKPFPKGGGAPTLVSNILMGHRCSDTLVARPLCRENRSRWQVKNRRGKEEGERQDL